MAKGQKSGKSRKSSNTARKARRRASWIRCNISGSGGRPCKKDRNVAKSSHGKFKNRAELQKGSKNKRTNHTKIDK